MRLKRKKILMRTALGHPHQMCRVSPDCRLPARRLLDPAMDFAFEPAGGDAIRKDDAAREGACLLPVRERLPGDRDLAEHLLEVDQPFSHVLWRQFAAGAVARRSVRRARWRHGLRWLVRVGAGAGPFGLVGCHIDNGSDVCGTAKSEKRRTRRGQAIVARFRSCVV